jgi:hypothetical protein
MCSTSMVWKVCALFLAVGTFGCNPFESCGPFSTNKTHFQDSLTVYVPIDSIKLEIFADYDYSTQIPITIIRRSEFSDSLKLNGAFEGEYFADSLYPKVELHNDTLTLRYIEWSMISPKSAPASAEKGNSLDPLCSPPADRTKLLSATLIIPPDLAVSIIWPSNIKVIE